MERVLKEQETKMLLALSLEELSQQPRLYHQRLSNIPQLPAPQKPPLLPNNFPYSTLTVETTTPSPTNVTLQVPPEIQYPTVWGCLTFEELYTRTYRYAAHVLYYSSNDTQDSLDDGLQVGYLKLWQRLQAEPQILADRSIGWIGKFVFHGALHTQQKEWRNSRRQVDITPLDANSPDTFEGRSFSSSTVRTHSHESRQTDIRIDLHNAIASVAASIMELPAGKEQDRNLWALYGITMLQVQVTEMSTLFGVNHRAMKRAYTQVHQLLEGKLQGYAPKEPTTPVHNRGQKSQPYQDISAIRQQNGDISHARYEQVRIHLDKLCPDTLQRDILALEGIQGKIPAREQARRHKISPSSMQRAYERIHLLLAAETNPSVTPRQPEKKRSQSFSFKPEYEPLIQLLANELICQPNNQGYLVALYSYICNLPNRATAKSFQMSEATLRRYRQRIQERFNELSKQAYMPEYPIQQQALQHD